MIIGMLSNFHQTISECWRRTPGTQKGSPFSLKGGRTKYKTKWDKKVLGTEIHSRELVVKEQKFPNNRKSSHRWVCGEFWNLRRQCNWEKNKNKNTEYPPNWNCQRRSRPDAHVRLQWVGSGQRDTGCMPKVRTRPESPEDNLRGLTWDSNPKCGIARERGKRERERELFWERV